MRKKSYPLENESFGIVTQVNQTYNGKEIPQTITTTAGVYVQSGQSIKIPENQENWDIANKIIQMEKDSGFYNPDNWKTIFKKKKIYLLYC